MKIRKHEYPGIERDRRHGVHRETVMRSNQGLCHICGEPYADAIDHIVPVAWGGSDDITNLAPAHRSCNSSKGASKNDGPDDWTWTRPSMWIEGYGPGWEDYQQRVELEDTREGIGQRFAEENNKPKNNKPKIHPVLATFIVVIAMVLLVSFLSIPTNSDSEVDDVATVASIKIKDSQKKYQFFRLRIDLEANEFTCKTRGLESLESKICTKGDQEIIIGSKYGIVTGSATEYNMNLVSNRIGVNGSMEQRGQKDVESKKPIYFFTAKFG